LGWAGIYSSWIEVELAGLVRDWIGRVEDGLRVGAARSVKGKLRVFLRKIRRRRRVRLNAVVALGCMVEDAAIG